MLFNAFLFSVIWLTIGAFQVWEAVFAVSLSGNGDPPPEWGIYSAWLYRSFRGPILVRVGAAIVHGLFWPVTWAFFSLKF